MLFIHFGFIGHQLCKYRRAKAAPPGYVFLRNFKRDHRDRVEQAIRDGVLEGHVMVVDSAYDEAGRPLPRKLATYAISQEAASLFFQFYARAKQERSRVQLSAPRVA
jgi:hypothetical protein